MHAFDIGLSTAALYPDVPTEEALTTAAELGFSVMEVFLQSEAEHDPGFGLELDRRRRATGVSIHSFHLHVHYFNLWTPYARRAQETRDRYLRVLEIAGRVGVRALTWHGIGSGPGHRAEHGFFDSLVWAAEQAHAAGITLCIENVSWCYLHGPEHVRALNALGVPLGYTFDTFQAGESHIDPVALIRAMGAQLTTVHLADYDPAGPRHLPLGEGLLDWCAIVGALTEIGYAGPLIIELADVESLSVLCASRDFIAQQFVKRDA